MEAAKRINWQAILGIALSVLIGGTICLEVIPQHRALVIFGLFSIPSHMLVAFIPQEPVLLYTAKHASPLQITLVAALGYSIASMLDYLLLLPLLSRSVIQSRIDNNAFYQRARRYFRKSPFLILLAANALPLPFYPLKFLSIVNHYPLWRYITAMLLGRLPRYYLLAFLGVALEIPTWALFGLLILFVTPPLLQRLLARTRPDEEAGTSIATQEDTRAVL